MLQPVDISASKNDRPVGSRNSMGMAIHGGFSASVDSSPHRLKAQINAANGGIGVSYSNVVLAGGYDPRDGSMPAESSYKYGYDPTSNNKAHSMLTGKAPGKYYCTRGPKPPSSLRAAGSRVALGGKR